MNGRLLSAALVGSLFFTTAYVAAPWASLAAQAPSAAATQAPDRPERVDLDAIYRIKEEGLQGIAGDGHAVVPHRRLGPAADEFPGDVCGREVGQQPPHLMGHQPAEVVTMLVNREEQFRDYAGKVRGKIVLIAPETRVTPLFSAIGHRFTDQELDDMQSQQGS